MFIKLSKSFLILAVALVATAGTAGAATTKARSLLREINRTRAVHHLRPLKLDARLMRAAKLHSRDMARTRVLAHTPRLLLLPGTRSAGENLAWIPSDSPAAVVAAWMASPHHRANLLSRRFTSVGLGDVSGLVTADFVG